MENDQRKEEKTNRTYNGKQWTTVIEGKIEWKAGRGRPLTPFIKQIIENIGKTNYKELKAIEVI